VIVVGAGISGIKFFQGVIPGLTIATKFDAKCCGSIKDKCQLAPVDANIQGTDQGMDQGMKLCMLFNMVAKSSGSAVSGITGFPCIRMWPKICDGGTESGIFEINLTYPLFIHICPGPNKWKSFICI
tara:strand:+ start:722 stop:1102 length:381 start_codon:yes stop_codon:yes gene_type:complete